MFGIKTAEDMARDAKAAVLEIVVSEGAMADTLSYEVGNYLTPSIFAPAFDARDAYDSDEERLDEIEASLESALGDLATAIRDNDVAPHEAADGDQDVIYSARTLAFYKEYTEEVDDEISNHGGLSEFETIGDAIQFGVYMVIRRGYELELQDMADAIEEIEALDII